MCAIKPLICSAILIVSLFGPIMAKASSIPPERCNTELATLIKKYLTIRYPTAQLKSEISAILEKNPTKKIEILNCLDQNQMTPILWFGDDLDMIKFLADQGANLTVLDNQLLYFAIGAGKLDVIKWLLEKGVLPSQRHVDFAWRTEPEETHKFQDDKYRLIYKKFYGNKYKG